MTGHGCHWLAIASSFGGSLALPWLAAKGHRPPVLQCGQWISRPRRHPLPGESGVTLTRARHKSHQNAGAGSSPSHGQPQESRP
jgi:hypothetical protein